MKRMSIYEPAMCCDTGVCGVNVDPELVRISTVINNLKKNGITIERYNLSSKPMAFVNNNKVKEALDKNGTANVLTIDIPTSKLANGNISHTGLVNIEKFTGKVPELTIFKQPKIKA